MAIDRNTPFANLLVESLAVAGLENVSISPGSRSTPLALAFGKNPDIQTWVLIDERSAAYFALGIAQATKKPVAILTTSGTAVANLFPAIIEARQSQIPLIILTADRPHELRQSGANQTIDQVKIFGESVKWFVDAPLPEANPSELIKRYLNTLASRAYSIADQLPAGPVHINFPFRKPLEPIPIISQEVSSYPATDPNPPGQASRQVRVISGTIRLRPNQIKELADRIRANPNGLIVLGPRSFANSYIDPLIEIARFTGYPILADPLSGARYTGSNIGEVTICGGYEWYLGNEIKEFPDLILRIGALPTSAALQDYLNSNSGAIHIGIQTGGAWNDPSHQLTLSIQSPPAEVFPALAGELTRHTGNIGKPEGWRATFSNREKIVAKALHETASSHYSEGLLARDLVLTMPEDSILFTASSLPIRHLDQFAPFSSSKITLYGNRGVSGIDGTISTAAGIAVGAQRPVTLLIGDLAFHHDQTGLLAFMQYCPGSTIVLINNGGGGIFHRLPISNYEPGFTKFFKTPISVNFKMMTEAYGGRYEFVENRSEFLALRESKLESDKFRVIEFLSDIESNERIRLEISKMIKERSNHD